MIKKPIEIDFTKQPLIKKPREYDSCNHPNCMVDDVARIITCVKCNAVLDPITVLAEMANKARHYVRRNIEREEFLDKQEKKYKTWEACRKKRSCPLLRGIK